MSAATKTGGGRDQWPAAEFLAAGIRCRIADSQWRSSTEQAMHVDAADKPNEAPPGESHDATAVSRQWDSDSTSAVVDWNANY